MDALSRDCKLDRTLGALTGIALGDALGMPSQVLTQAEISAGYGWISDFVAPLDGHPVADGLAPGTVTDDTEQTLLLAAQILDSPDRFDQETWAQALLAWEEGVKSRGLLDLLGPSTKRALEAFSAGVSITETGRAGNTNGAAMRIAPVGVATPVEPLGVFVDHIHATCQVTHNTSEAVAAAAAVAATISAGVDGAVFGEAVPLALAAAHEGEKRADCRSVGMRDRIETAIGIGGSHSATSGMRALASQIGTSVVAIESIATAFGIVRLAAGDPWQAAVLSANIGDDTDTIGAIATGMAGACVGAAALPAEKVATVMSVNKLDLEPVACGLLSVRANRSRCANAAEHN